MKNYHKQTKKSWKLTKRVSLWGDAPIYPKQLNHISGILLKKCMLNANGLFSLILGQNSITLYLQIYLTTLFEICYNDIYSKAQMNHETELICTLTCTLFLIYCISWVFGLIIGFESMKTHLFWNGNIKPNGSNGPLLPIAATVFFGQNIHHSPFFSTCD